MSDPKSITQIEISRRRILVRVDFNVPLDNKLGVADTTRIEQAVPTIRYALEKNAQVVLATHLGRPRGAVVPNLSLRHILTPLEHLIGRPVKLLTGCVGPTVLQTLNRLERGTVALLENLRFHKEEENNDRLFAIELASCADIYINDAFGVSHRQHASVAEITKHFKAKGMGFLVQRELNSLSRLLDRPTRPFVVVLGGAKVSDKIGLIRSLLPRVHTIIVGGAMAYTLLAAQGINIGRSLVEIEKKKEAALCLQEAARLNVNIHLPVDHVVIPHPDFPQLGTAQTTKHVPPNHMGVDIGPMSIDKFQKAIRGAKTILWNGPMGIFESPPYDFGTRAIADAVASNEDCFSVAGGGDTVAALNLSGLGEKVSHVSTGGGASLEFLEAGTLVAIEALRP